MNKSNLHFIYVPGLGDENVNGQTKAIKLWKYWGVEPEMCQMNWRLIEGWENKLNKLLNSIDQACASGKQVVLVGASAGGSAVINGYGARKDKVYACILIAGKINHPEKIGQGFIRRNPDFLTSANDCQEVLKNLEPQYRKRILSLYGLVDEMVPKRDSFVPGGVNKYVVSGGHFITIAKELITGMPKFLRFVKSLDDNLNN